MLFFLVLVYMLVAELSKATGEGRVSEYDGETLRGLTYLTVGVWSVYPIVWMLGQEGTGFASLNAEQTSLTLADLLVSGGLCDARAVGHASDFMDAGTGVDRFGVTDFGRLGACALPVVLVGFWSRECWRVVCQSDCVGAGEGSFEIASSSAKETALMLVCSSIDIFPLSCVSGIAVRSKM